MADIKIDTDVEITSEVPAPRRSARPRAAEVKAEEVPADPAPAAEEVPVAEEVVISPQTRLEMEVGARTIGKLL